MLIYKDYFNINSEHKISYLKHLLPTVKILFVFYLTK